MSETPKRIFMGLVMACLVMAAIIYLSPMLFYVVVALMLLITGCEWSALIFEKKLSRAIFCLLLVIGLVTVFWLKQCPSFDIIILIASVMAIFIGIIQVFVFANHRQSAFVQSKWLRALLSLVLLFGAQYFITQLRWHGNVWIVYALALVAMFDTGAYFSGRSFGKHPLAKKLSPKKTWEGFLGGCILGVILSVGLMYCMHLQYPLSIMSWIFVVTMTIIMAMISVFGDLFESMQKRIADKKDSSNLIPGHGGFFDRIDALLFVLPVMFIYRDILVFLMNRQVIMHTLILLKH